MNLLLLLLWGKNIAQNCKYLQTNAYNKLLIKTNKPNLGNQDWLILKPF
jgi:hypothetical protein